MKDGRSSADKTGLVADKRLNLAMTRGRRIPIRRCFIENSQSATRTVRLTIRYL